MCNAKGCDLASPSFHGHALHAPLRSDAVWRPRSTRTYQLAFEPAVVSPVQRRRHSKFQKQVYGLSPAACEGSCSAQPFGEPVTGLAGLTPVFGEQCVVEALCSVPHQVFDVQPGPPNIVPSPRFARKKSDTSCAIHIAGLRTQHAAAGEQIERRLFVLPFGSRPLHNLGHGSASSARIIRFSGCDRCV